MIKMITMIIGILSTCSTFGTGIPNEEITFGTFTYYGEEGVQFKSYDDENWWYLEYEDLGEKPPLNKPVAIVFDNNGTVKGDECCDDDCCCWAEDDEFKKLIKNF